MNKTVLVLLAWMAISAMPVVASEPALAMEASGSIVDGKPMIVFKLTNTTNQSMQISVSQLPWKQRHNIVIAVVSKKSGEPLRPKFRIDDNFESGALRVDAGESMQGTLSLDRYVGGLRELLSKEDVLVFWHYAASGDSSTALGEQGGWFAVSKIQSR
jgi:hypothetical protein